jgi:transcription initiation factor TFIIE subunit alpha
MNKQELDLAAEILGEKVIKLIEKMDFEKTISEYKLAEKLNLDINTTRNLLYVLAKHNLVSFTKEKDKLKGWYIYHWTLHQKKFKEFLIKSLEKKCEKLQELVEKENSELFFICQNKCARINFEQALNFNFKCPECGCLLEEDNDRKNKIRKYEEEINALKNIILKINSEGNKKTQEVKNKEIKKGRTRNFKIIKKTKNGRLRTSRASISIRKVVKKSKKLKNLRQALQKRRKYK